MQLLVKNSFTGFYFVKLNWATACVLILIKSVNDDKTVANKIDGASGTLQYSEVGNIKSREYQNNTVTCWAMQFMETCSFSKLNINTNICVLAPNKII